MLYLDIAIVCNSNTHCCANVFRAWANLVNNTKIVFQPYALAEWLVVFGIRLYGASQDDHIHIRIKKPM